jgi:hypothetical protein
MGRSFVVLLLLAAVIPWACGTPRPDPRLLDEKPTAFTNPPLPKPEETAKAKQVPEQTALMRFVIMPAVYTGIIIAGLGCLILYGIAERGGGWYPNSTK